MRQVVLSTALCCAAPFAVADVLVVDPDPGAFPVGTPQTLQYPNQSLRVTASTSRIQILSPSGASPSWLLLASSPTGGELQTGCYERATRFATSSRPELDFSFGGSGCNATHGRFRVLELQVSGSTVTSLAIDFAQQCQTDGKAVSGKVRYNSSIPVDGPSMRPVFDPTGTMSFTSEPGAIGGGSQGNALTFSLDRRNIRVSRNFDQGVSTSYNGPVAGGPSTVSWMLDFAAPGDVPLAAQAYPNATRFPFQAADVAGFAFSYGSAGCNTLSATFTVSAVAYDALDGLPIRFAANFGQRCPNSSGPLSSGSVSFDLNPIGPTSLPDPQIVFRSGMESGEGGVFVPSCDN